MKHRAILNITFAVYSTTMDGKISPSFEYNGKALRVIDGDSEQECIEKVKDFFKKNGCTITKEQKYESSERNSIRRSDQR